MYCNVLHVRRERERERVILCNIVSTIHKYMSDLCTSATYLKVLECERHFQSAQDGDTSMKHRGNAPPKLYHEFVGNSVDHCMSIPDITPRASVLMMMVVVVMILHLWQHNNTTSTVTREQANSPVCLPTGPIRFPTIVDSWYRWQLIGKTMYGRWNQYDILHDDVYLIWNTHSSAININKLWFIKHH